MNSRDVALQVPGCLETVVAEVADVVVALVDAPDVVVQVRSALELLAAPARVLSWVLKLCFDLRDKATKAFVFLCRI